MRYLFIMIILLALTSTISAKDRQPLRGQMLLEGKHLTQRYETLKIREEAWQKRKESLILHFKKKHKIEENLEEANHYRKQRFEKRKKAFYDSLQEREDEIVNEFSCIAEKLENLSVKFSHRYGVSLSKKEMFGGSAPKVKDKKRKIRLLKKYLKSTKSWKTCLQQAQYFDKSRTTLELRTNISEKKYNRLSLRLDKKTEKNFIALNKYEEKSVDYLATYALDYGYSIPDVSSAKTLLNNILKSR